MIAIDTNVLVRVIVEDHGQPEQTRAARELVAAAKRVYLTQIVQVELAWVLKKVLSRSGFVTPTEMFEVRADVQNVSDGVANPVAPSNFL